MRQEATAFAAPPGVSSRPGATGWLLISPLVALGRSPSWSRRRSSCWSTASPARHARRRGLQLHPRELRRGRSTRRTCRSSSARSSSRPSPPPSVWRAGYPVAYLHRPRARALAQHAAHAGHGAVLDQLPDPHLRLGDDPEEPRPAQLLAPALRAHRRSRSRCSTRRGAVVLGLVYTFLPFMILPIYTSVEKLDNALVEAAFDLGAGPLRAFSRVIVPMTSPGITAGVLLVFIPALGIYAVNDILGGGTRRHDRQHHREPVQGQRPQLAVRRRPRDDAPGELRDRLLGGEPPPAGGPQPRRALTPSP